jgi:hypothetical protein
MEFLSLFNKNIDIFIIVTYKVLFFVGGIVLLCLLIYSIFHFFND